MTGAGLARSTACKSAITPGKLASRSRTFRGTPVGFAPAILGGRLIGRDCGNSRRIAGGCALARLLPARPSQLPSASGLQFREGCFVDPWPSDPYHVPAWFDQIPRQMHGLAQPAPRPVPTHRVANAPAGCEAASAIRRCVGQQTQHHQRMGVAATCLPHLPESFLVSQSIPALQQVRPSKPLPVVRRG